VSYLQPITPVSIRFISPINYESDQNNEGRIIAKNALGKCMYSELAQSCVGDAQIIFVRGNAFSPIIPSREPARKLAYRFTFKPYKNMYRDLSRVVGFSIETQMVPQFLFRIEEYKVFWLVTPCKWANPQRRFGGIYHLSRHG
jgi:hypothetical protein